MASLFTRSTIIPILKRLFASFQWLNKNCCSTGRAEQLAFLRPHLLPKKDGGPQTESDDRAAENAPECHRNLVLPPRAGATCLYWALLASKVPWDEEALSRSIRDSRRYNHFQPDADAWSPNQNLASESFIFALPKVFRHDVPNKKLFIVYLPYPTMWLDENEIGAWERCRSGWRDQTKLLSWITSYSYHPWDDLSFKSYDMM